MKRRKNNSTIEKFYKIGIRWLGVPWIIGLLGRQSVHGLKLQNLSPGPLRVPSISAPAPCFGLRGCNHASRFRENQHLAHCNIRAPSSGTMALSSAALPTPDPTDALSPKTSPPPLPPWTFRASHIDYQFRWIKADKAKQYSSFVRKDRTTNTSPLSFVSLGGFTLGGIFCVEYKDSPIGPYKEVAILSGLVIGPGFSLGAWASHIFVDSPDAAEYGSKFWGLPACVVPIEFSWDNSKQQDGCQRNLIFSSSSDSLSTFDSSPPLLANTASLSREKIVLTNWPANRSAHRSISRESSHKPLSLLSRVLSLIDLILPSFSGALPLDKRTAINCEENELDTSDTLKRNRGLSGLSPLLQYPLRIQRPGSIGVLDNRNLVFEMQCSDPLLSQSANHDQGFREIDDLLKGSKTLFSIGIDEVKLEAGISKQIS